MVDKETETKPETKTETQPQPETESKSAPVNPRVAIREARQRRLKLISSSKSATIKVFAANEALRGVLRHPATGIRFRELDQPVEWPNDSFTQRRIKEGSVLTEASSSGEAAEEDESLNARQQSAARYGKQTVAAKKQERSAERPEIGARPPHPEHQPEQQPDQPQPEHQPAA